LVQLGVAVISYVASFALVLDLDLGQLPWGFIMKTLALLVAVRIASLVLFRLYRGLWRYTSVFDLVQIVKATTVSSLLFVAFEIPIFGLEEMPTSVLLLDWAGNIFLLGGIRLFVRTVRERFYPLRATVASQAPSKRLLIVGAGDAGAALCKQALQSPGFRFTPVAFVDDDPGKAGDHIHGVPIVGLCEDISWIVDRYQVEAAIIAMPSATPGQRRTVVDILQRERVRFTVLPSTPDIIDGNFSIRDTREVDPLDLLGRPPARLDRPAIKRFIRGKRLFITGAAGSVGSELVRQAAGLDPELLLLVDQAENPLLFLESEIRTLFPDVPLLAQIADVTDEIAMRRLVAEHRPHVLLHAAAHKHVPFMELVPAKAVRNNVGGTYVLADCAIKYGVEKFVLVSTDKAVNPTSVMGATKRLAEMLTKEMNRLGNTRLIAVRFGNVLGSNASVVPIFKQQISSGGPVTVTHPDVTRYFMSIPEAAGLILQAGAVGSGGETFMLEMGDAVRILDLAETMINLSGLQPHRDVEIIFTGLRPGEKLHEELHSDAEKSAPTGFDKLSVVRGDSPAGDIVAQVEKLLAGLPGIEGNEVKVALKRLVPEYHPAHVVATALDA
jgi:FlaA1/EpsC-like NDP-sugar epimerase